MKTYLFALACSMVLWSAAAASAQTSYVLGPQDVVNITVLGEEDLSRKYTIEQDGTFTFPLIGRVTARGLTLRALEQELKNKLASGFLKNPQVSVAVDAYQSQRIMVWGQVNQPGEYQLSGDTTLLSALAKAGSVTPNAGRVAVIVRSRKSVSGNGTPADPEILRIDLTDLQAGNMSLNIPLLDGDTINIPKAQSVFVSGQVKNPGGYAVEEGMTVLQVLSLAGGLTDRGSDRRINILRTVDGKKKERKGVKLTDVIEPGDTIVVGQRIF
jgi:polysaccharide export outer membrane protein